MRAVGTYDDRLGIRSWSCDILETGKCQTRVMELPPTIALRSSDTFSNFTVKPTYSGCFSVSCHWPVLLQSLQSSGRVLIKALYPRCSAAFWLIHKTLESQTEHT